MRKLAAFLIGVICFLSNAYSAPEMASAYVPSTEVCFYANVSLENALCPPASSNPGSILGGTSGYYAYAWADQVGMNIHLGESEYQNMSSLVPIFQYLNIHHARDGISILAQNSTVSGYANTLYSSAGVKIDALTSFIKSAVSIHNDLSLVTSGAVESIEGPNEIDLNDGGGTWQNDGPTQVAINQSYVGTYAPGTKLIGTSLGGPGASYGSFNTNMSSEVDYGNTHDYTGGYNPETAGYGGAGYGGFLYGGVDYNIANELQAYPGVPVAATEFGFDVTANNNNSVDVGIQGAYALRQIFAHQSRNVRKSYLYALLDSGGQHYGIMQDLNTARVAFRDIGGFMNIVKDTTPVNGACTVPASVSTSGISSFGLCFSDGRYALVLWKPNFTWDTNNHIYNAINTTNVPLTYSVGFAPSSVTQWKYPLYGDWSNSGLLGSGLIAPSVPVSDLPSVVMFNGPSSPAALPTPPVIPASPTPGPGAPTPAPTATPTATPTPTPVPTATPTPIAVATAPANNLLTYGKQLNPATLTAPGATPAPDGNKYSVMHNRFLIAENGTASIATYMQAQIPYVAQYYDFANACPDTTANPFNCYPDGSPTASGPIAENYFAHGSNGGRVVNGVGLPVSGSVASQTADIRYRAAFDSQPTVVKNQIASTVTAGDSAHVYTASFWDDQFNPADSASAGNSWYSWIVSPYSLTANDGSGGHDAAPYTGYSDTNWMSGVGVAIQNAPHPVIINCSGWIPSDATNVNGTLAPAPAECVTEATDNANALGAMQEGQFTNPYAAGGTTNQSGQQPLYGKSWASNVNFLIALQTANKYDVDFEHSTATAQHVLSASVSAGTHAATPQSMIGIVPGTSVTIGSETVAVASTTATTFTATFASSHSSGASFTVDDNATGVAGWQTRKYQYASLMLGMDKPTLVGLLEDYHSSLETSGVPLPVEAQLIPTQPVVSAPAIYSAGSPNTTGVYALQASGSGSTYACHHSGGASTGKSCVFVREYAACYLNGTAIGQCASVVFPDQPLFNEQASDDLMPFPTLTQAYAHTFSCAGNLDIVAGLGDSGSCSVVAAAPPTAGTMEHPQQAFILTQ